MYTIWMLNEDGKFQAETVCDESVAIELTAEYNSQKYQDEFYFYQVQV